MRRLSSLSKHCLLSLLTLLICTVAFAQNDYDYFSSLHSDPNDVRDYIEKAYTDINVPPVSESTFNNVRTTTVGQTFVDPNFGREWTFMYDGGDKILNSERRAWNSDGTLIALMVKSFNAYNDYALFDGSDASYIRTVRFNKPNSNVTELRWMPNDPDKMFYMYGNKMYTFDINTETIATFETFASFTLTGTKITKGDGNDVDTNGDFLICNSGSDCFVYNFLQKKVVREVNGNRTYYDPGSSFTTFSLGNLDYAIAFAGHIIELDEDNGGTYLRDINGNFIQELYRRTPHFDPTYFLDNGTLYPGLMIRYNNADANHYNNAGLPTASDGDSFFHGWDPSNPSGFVRFEMSSWPSTTLSSGGQHSTNRAGGTTGIILQHGPGEYNLSPWDARYGECYEHAYYTADATMDRRFAHHYIGYDAGYSTSYQPEGFISPNGEFAIIKTKWGWYKVELGTRMSKAEVDAYLNGTTTYTLTTNVSGAGSITQSPTGTVHTDGTVVSLTANPDSGYQFDGWSGDLTGSSNPASITMNSNKSVTAVFSAVGGNPNTYQAEDATISNGIIASNHAGYTGTGFVDYTNMVGSYVEFAVNTTSAADYHLIVRFASGSSNNRPMEISVNGSTQLASVDYQPTGAWDTWNVDTVTITLTSGANTIRLEALTSEGGPNVDKIELEEIIVNHPTEYQAEDATISNGQVETNHAGYTGTGFVDFTNMVGSYVSFDVSVAGAGDYLLDMRFASGSTNNRPMEVQVNGTVVYSSVDFQPTGGWATWSVNSVAIALNSGSNTIRLTGTTAEGGPNMDKIDLSVATEFQAEDATLSNASFSDIHTGYTGTGFVDYANQVGSYVEWDVTVLSAGSYEVDLRFANGSSANRTMEIDINGSTELSSVDFNATGAWNSWSTQTFTVSLAAGANTIRATALTTDGGPNVDKITVAPSSGSRLGSLSEVDQPLTQVMVFPNPFENQLKVDVSLEQGGAVQIDLINLSGKRITSLSKSLAKGAHLIPLDVSQHNLENGIYLMRVHTPDKVFTIKVIRR